MWHLSPPKAVLETVSLDKFIPESPASSEPGDMSPCRSPSTPRHLRYRQAGGTHTHTHTPHGRRASLLRAAFYAIFPLSLSHIRGESSLYHVASVRICHRHRRSRTRQLPGWVGRGHDGPQSQDRRMEVAFNAYKRQECPNDCLFPHRV